MKRMNNIMQDKINRGLRDAILDGDLEKTRNLLNARIMKPDIHSITEREKGGFSMLHCAVLSGNHQIIIMLLQMDINHMLLTSDGYSALDLALWKGQYEIADMLRKEGLIAPMKEPESLNGRRIIYRGQKATVVAYVDDPAESSSGGTRRPTKMRRLVVEETGNEILVNCWTGLDYQLESSSTKHNQYTITNTSPSMNLSPSMLSPVSSSILSETFPEEEEEEEEEEEDAFAQVVEVQARAGPLGLLLDAMILDAAVVNGFKKLGNGRKGDIEQSTLVKPRMMIIGINDMDVSKKSLRQITQLLAEHHQDEKRMRFSFRRPGVKRGHRLVVPQHKPAETTEDNNQIEEDDVAKLPKKCPYCQMPTHAMDACPYK